jgi:hypothetical protein
MTTENMSITEQTIRGVAQRAKLTPETFRGRDRSKVEVENPQDPNGPLLHLGYVRKNALAKSRWNNILCGNASKNYSSRIEAVRELVRACW